MPNFSFGGGPRDCIGNHFAWMEAVLVLATIAKRYRLRVASNHHEVKPHPSITLRPKRGLRMIVEKRNEFGRLSTSSKINNFSTLQYKQLEHNLLLSDFSKYMFFNIPGNIIL
ncbi:cytochrome P450 [Peribacillus butanolivorans]|uniref:cytochrome P450 n=1 Tax=Peribacillus butanolivorans TaxID=421767 RepID=UPI00167F2FCE|nr:cytochrome P450 [Peribacillus butanolivorans]QNU04614.1 cytochrome P450 [Peribacillus butanolivorans]